MQVICFLCFKTSYNKRCFELGSSVYRFLFRSSSGEIEIAQVP